MATLYNDSEAHKRVTFAWWNTSLAPSGDSRNCEELRQNAIEVIAYLFKVAKVDFLALGETSIEDLDSLRELEIFEELEFRYGISKAGKSKFDICYISNPNKITILNSENITYLKGNSTLKIAQRIDVLENHSGTVFNLFASHWPSRLWCDKDHPDRHTLGINLRLEVDKILNESPNPPHIILLGDYNDEPFDISLSHHLMATRDIDLVNKRKHLFYNPYWSQMGQDNGENKKRGGSYFYKSGKTTQWHTFDQIIYSHAFVSAKKWRLAQDNVHIIDVPGLAELVTSTKSKFDHIPVCGIIEKVN
ncbi:MULTISPECIES: endonuclease/exonuclease/phosphatase family protein [unclassified Pseudomonas]|uniref:endonuclease/exonuclease/phosphatase family protein n=1 Tax=unclassified Pseudomonas TaxID=196821 RepID=UPI00087639AD|nr:MULTISPECIES: endonuclease/exonuclease/phosphatase family protein [unclassified Pseudomonas]SCZ38084.1 Endonuclease/Exonuclease/phosphatase family protein [Pseudomonas sp. NFACC44-2]SDA88642.1 Endonuclease/Exonuclease/phosphatase family protein [Pseudomonas sp. NFACC51]SFI02693.1 Endonuclease/Exonuclease/phosphatase family protein [Pseudomonas sp. NFACC54]SFT24439.1 Endonuclease/Exonuclease/phosphatase family protein [Pseudomonas sp. NFACC48-1]